MDRIPHVSQWKDYSVEGVDYGIGPEPEDFRLYGLPEYGIYSDMLGILDADDLPPLAVEVDQGLYGNQILARTPMIELAPKDWKYVSVLRTPYHGMMGVGDDGQIYEYDGTLGFFKKLFRKAKKAVKRVARGVRSKIRKVISKIPGGKYVLKLGQKIFKIAHKLVRPLTRFVGKYATKLAPVAALIPGYGPAIAGAMYSAGKIAQLMNEYDVAITGAVGKVRKLKFKSGKKAKGFRKALKRAAKLESSKLRKMGKRAYESKVKSAFKRR